MSKVSPIEKTLIDSSVRTLNMKRRINHDEIQRRNPVVDLYGISKYQFGDAGVPADLDVWITPDLIKIERFEFKIKVSDLVVPYSSTSIDGTTLSINNTSLTSNNNNISPNPHNHSITPSTHTHNMTTSPSTTSSSINNFRVEINGVDLTSVFATQFGIWVNGTGTFPSEEVEFNFDVMEACNYISGADSRKILSAGQKKFRFTNNGLFNVELIIYLKFTHNNR